MDGRLRTILEQLPPDPPRSKLEPYADLIRDLRRRRKTYRAIAAFLAEHCNLQVQHSTIYDFVRVRKRDRTPSQSQSQLNPPMQPVHVPSDSDERTTIENSRPASPQPQPQRDIYAHFQELKRRNSAPPPPQPKPRFHYEEGEPLELIDRTKYPRKKD
jgi:IS30 family transposase